VKKFESSVAVNLLHLPDKPAGVEDISALPFLAVNLLHLPASWQGSAALLGLTF
jgi:hypothetical protein